MSIRRYLSKAFVIVTILGLSTSLLANELPSKKILTIEEATKMAVNNNSQLRTYELSMEATKEKMKDDRLEFYQYMDMDISKRQLDQTMKFLKDQITYDVWKSYNSYILAQQQLVLMEKEITLAAKEQKQAEIKKERGIISQVDYDTILVKIENTKNEELAKEQEIVNLSKNFKMLVGVDINKYELENNITYEAFKQVGSIDSYIESKVDDMLKYNEESVKYADETRIERASINGMAPYWSDYLGEKANTSQKATTIEQQREQYKKSLLSTYATLLSNEKQLEQLNANSKVQNKQLKVAEIKYQAGLISAYEYESTKQQVDQTSYQIISLTYACETAKKILEKPWVA